ncbi:prepilin-type N-terminal cleavage/methylation domain-containing protein [Flaviramulus sp. BrNp1-15]|uniref:prepilin-type N-terminal cleavage/methylation domain-containing protein n=1 Tax=Flaviramulus sp. BrNp1-15 TaxID=2916754 RepID=UPI001EE8280E|nr:prepilin-type N-terminal cleavage/methylation domain-containing protein [Flaviramulus sp. BrNp1-15]ULC57934.1 prepilin-type N-terminal cleavage/methylation domain-containing protein [Flaviramulus sp. BrNp1-15]
MKTKHKIQAFTLSEMIVVIIITSIIVGMAFSVLSMVQKHMSSIQSNFTKNTELNKLEQALWIDFNRYTNIKYDIVDDELIFTSEMDTISYKFTEDSILKNLDTFNIQVQNKLFFFDGTKAQNGQIDAIKMETSKTFQNQQLFVFKQNDATLFMN